MKRDPGESSAASDEDVGFASADDVEWVAHEEESGLEGSIPGADAEEEEGGRAAPTGADAGGKALGGEEAAAPEADDGEEAFAGEGAPREAGAGGKALADEKEEWILPDEEEPVDPAAIAAAAAAAAEGGRPVPTEPVLVPGVSDDAERTALLIEFLRDQERRARLWVQKPRRRVPAAATLGIVALISAAAWLWMLPPDWVQPNLPPPVPAEFHEAGLRLGMYLQAQQIEAFRRQRGRLPDVLQETGEPVPGMYYRRLNAREYRLHGVTPRLALTYVSTDSLTIFLSNAHRVVGFGVGR
ncbi:MAG: hypothetical protein KY453_00515 [Gemmatimonadetes bacterium]|nr:hypothetical protein [Gemmatimonadota bacterium]